jgi:ATP-binding protein involved in chromosome partitioning
MSPLVADEKANFVPVTKYGIETVSIGHASEPEVALLWKGVLVGQVVSEFLRKANWSPLDYLLVDTPPGTGDVHLSLAQLFPIDGAIIVTTPQKVAVADVARSIDAFKQLKVPVLGLVQNFGSFVCGGCKSVVNIFPGTGGEDLAKKYKLPLLGCLPIDPEIARSGDAGVPAVLDKPDSEYAKAFQAIAETIISLCPRVKSGK